MESHVFLIWLIVVFRTLAIFVPLVIYALNLRANRLPGTFKLLDRLRVPFLLVVYHAEKLLPRPYLGQSLLRLFKKVAKLDSFDISGVLLESLNVHLRLHEFILVTYEIGL